MSEAVERPDAGPKTLGEIVEDHRKTFELVAAGDDSASRFARRALREATDE